MHAVYIQQQMLGVTDVGLYNETVQGVILMYQVHSSKVTNQISLFIRLWHLMP